LALELKTENTDVVDRGRRSGWETLNNFRMGKRITNRDRMFFTEQLALLLETGTNLHASLQALRRQVGDTPLALLIEKLIEDVSEGKTFSFALSRHPTVFSRTYVNVIAASEAGGFMHQMLQQLQEMEEKRDRLRSTLVSALAYPVFLILFSIAVVIFVLAVVFPKFAELFASIENQLPVTTKWLMSASDLLVNHWPWLLLGIGLVMVLMRAWLLTESGKLTIDRTKLGLPGLRSIFVKLYMVQSLRVMGLSMGNGVGVMDTLQACRELIQNRLFEAFIIDVETRVRQGSGIASGFASSSFVPQVVAQMVTTGEETGNLSKVMRRLADHYEKELERSLTLFSKMVEPVMLLVMGLIVGLLASSLILPIFKLSRAVQ
jgi:type II secretory pathway component PulF